MEKWNRRSLRGPGLPVTPDEEEDIVRMVQEGKSYIQIAQEIGRATQTVANVVKRRGILPFRPPPEAAHAARSDYAKERRIDLLNKAFAKAEEILDNYVYTPIQLQQWASAFGILVEKRRLEDGDATERSEVIDTSQAREQLRSKLTRLAQRRGAAGVAQSA